MSIKIDGGFLSWVNLDAFLEKFFGVNGPQWSRAEEPH